MTHPGELAEILDVLEDLLEYAEEFTDAGCWHLHQSARAVEVLRRHGRQHQCAGSASGVDPG